MVVDKELLIMLIILLIFYVISMINRFTAFDTPKKVKYIYPHEMDTGDLLCVSYNNFSTEFIGTFTNSVWVHVGIVWVDTETNNRYVLEGAIYGGKHYKHFFAIPVDLWMHINRKNIMAWKKYHGPKIDSQQMIEQFSPFIKFSKLEGLNLDWYRFLLNRDYVEHKQKQKYTCFEAIIILGQEIGIFKKDKHYASHFPSSVVNDNISLCDGVSYDDKIQIKMTEYYRKLMFLDMIDYPDFWKK